MTAADRALRATQKLSTDGLLEVDALESLAFTVERTVGTGKARKSHSERVDGVTATDREFLGWVVAQLDGLDVGNRLQFRLALFSLLKDLKALRSKQKHGHKVRTEGSKERHDAAR
jgi:hypothetical protein